MESKRQSLRSIQLSACAGFSSKIVIEGLLILVPYQLNACTKNKKIRRSQKQEMG
jgi:hypothetical protein